MQTRSQRTKLNKEIFDIVQIIHDVAMTSNIFILVNNDTNVLIAGKILKMQIKERLQRSIIWRLTTNKTGNDIQWTDF